MLEYVLKSAGCLVVLFGFYKIFLEAEKSNMFKRFYLLFILILSAILPLISFSYEVAAPDITEEPSMIITQTQNSSVVSDPGFYEQHGNTIWLTVYLVGFIIFLFRFLRNINKMLRIIKSAERKEDLPYIYVLLLTATNPFSFLHYIFFRKSEFESSEISEAVIAHEKAHVDQKHSWDLLLLELMHVIFWFNPLFIFIKKSVKLNHEFLADEQVLNKHQNLRDYSELLLGYSRGQEPNVLASPINHSLIKKRILMMTKNLSARRLSMKMLLLAPILGGCIYTFNEEIVAKPVLSIDESLELIELQKKKSVNITVNNEDILLYDQPVSLENFAEELDKVTKNWNEWQLKYPYFYADFANSTTGFIEKLNAEYRKTELSRISGTEFLAPSIPDTAGTPPPPPPPVRSIEGREPVSKRSKSDFKETRKNLFSIQVIGNRLRVNGVNTNPDKLSEILDKLSEGRTDEELEAFNFRMQVTDPAPGFMEMLNDEFRKSRMSRVSGHDILPPPPPGHHGEDHQSSKPPKPPKSVKTQQAPKPPKPPKSPKATKAGRLSQTSVPNPPAPPAAPDPLKTLEEIQLEGGSFYLNEKKVSVGKAKRTIESNNYTNIHVHQTGDSEGYIKITGSR
ncbi:M56 family metallopeptidase [Christiangramia portivictoriae]|uniref:M56 family metallopeptidase n=1 Tax=Christiangramia portivictoriae TaxID=326069 RepID=UPI00040C4D2A|nr:M56 family metallopeptidase [Christiangramia portivictoriae]